MQIYLKFRIVIAHACFQSFHSPGVLPNQSVLGGQNETYLHLISYANLPNEYLGDTTIMTRGENNFLMLED